VVLGPPLWQGLMAWPLFEHCRGRVPNLVWLSGRAFPSMARGGPSVHGGVHYGLLRSLGAPRDSVGHGVPTLRGAS
jgi:hypothetical protein